MMVSGGVCTAVEQRKELFQRRNLSHLDELVQKEREIKEKELQKLQSTKDKKKKSPFDKLDAWDLVIEDNKKSLEWCEKRLRQKKAERARWFKETGEEAVLGDAAMGAAIAEYEQNFMVEE